EAPAPTPTEPEQGEIDWLGIQYQDLSPQLRQMHSMPTDLNGVWVTQVAPDSPLFDEQVRAGDVIVEVNGDPVGDVSSFEEAVGAIESGKFVRLYVSRVNPRTGEVAASFFAVVRVP
ncbi:MAG: PDZ domain-containing protein, partial [Acidobacteriota bacterium]